MDQAPIQRGFLSFARPDFELVSSIFAASTGQRFTLWDYSEPGEGVPLGSDLLEAIRIHVRDATFMIALISPDSLANEFCEAEIQAAQDFGLKIVPLVTAETQVNVGWPGSFEPLRHLKLFCLETAQPEEFDRFVRRLCESLNLLYAQRVFAHPELPLYDRFVTEWGTTWFGDKETQVAVHRELVELQDQFSASYARAKSEAEFRLAAEDMTALLAFTRRKFSSKELYYPRVIYAVCLAEAGQVEHAGEVLKDLGAHPLKDWTYFQALGYLNHLAGDYSAARANYESALKYRPKMPFLLFGAAMNALLTHTKDGNEYALNLLDPLNAAQAVMSQRIRRLRAIVKGLQDEGGITKESLANIFGDAQAQAGQFKLGDNAQNYATNNEVGRFEQLAIADYRHKRYGSSWKNYASALSLSPGDPDLVFGAVVNALLDDSETAKLYARSLLETAKQSETALSESTRQLRALIATLLEQQGHEAEALRVLQSVVDEETDPRTLPQIMLQTAALMVKMHRLNDALALLSNRPAATQANPSLQRAHAFVLYQLNRKEEALRILSAQLSASDLLSAEDERMARVDAARLYADLGEVAKVTAALAPLLEAARFSLSTPETWEALAYATYAKGEFAEAERLFATHGLDPGNLVWLRRALSADTKRFQEIVDR